MVIGPKLKLKLKPKFKKGRGGGVDLTSPFNVDVAKQRAEIEKFNTELRSRGIPVDSFPGESAESKRQRIEQDKEKVSQERISSGKISAQVESRIQPAAFEQFDPQGFTFTSGFRREGGEATKSFFTEAIPDFIAGSGKALGNLLVGDTRELERINPFRVFKDVGKRKGEKPLTFTPQFGTITPESTSGGVIPVTSFDVLRIKRREAGVPEELLEAPISVIQAERTEAIKEKIESGFGQQIDIGRITEKEAQKQAENLFKFRVEKEVEPLSSLSAEGLRVRTGETISRQVQSFLPAVGLTALSLTPSGAIIGGSLSIAGAGFLATRGKQKIREGDVRGGVVDIGTGALFATAGFASLGTAGARFESQITASRLSALQQKPLSLGGDFTIGKRGVITKISGSRVTEFGTQQVDVISPVFTQRSLQSGSQTFSIVGGRVASTTRLEPFRFMGGFSTPPVAILKSSETFSFIGRGLSPISSGGRIARQGFTVDFPKDFKTATGSIDFVRGGKRITTGFGGISKSSDLGIDIISGPLVKGRPSLQGGGTFLIKPEAAGTLVQKTGKDFFLDLKVIKIGGIPVSPQTPITSGGGLVSVIKPVAFKPSDIGGTVIRTGGALPSSSFASSGFTSSTLSGGPLQTLSLSQLQTSQIGAGFASGARIATLVKPSVSIAKSSLTPTLSFIPFSSQVQGFEQRQGTLQITPQRSSQALDLEFKQTLGLATLTEQETRQQSKQQQKTKVPTQPDTPIVVPVIPVTRPAVSKVSGGVSAFPFGPFPFLPLPTFPTGRVPTKGRKKGKSRVAPSLTGLTLFELGDITGGPLPTSGLPGLSLVPESFVKRKKKKSKKKK